MSEESLEEIIDKRIGEIRISNLDISYSEIINLHETNEIVIHPDYQRLFRWSQGQSSRLIESILLGLPIPQIFFIENEDGILELIDGLQRVSSVIAFINPEKIDKEPLILDGCELVPELNSLRFSELPMVLKLNLKRSVCRAVIIKKQSLSELRYAMFKRLNTGGEILSHQEVRNCTSRMVGETGVKFYRFLQECAANQNFRNTRSKLSEAKLSQRGDEELVLRFFALRIGFHGFKAIINEWLDWFMEQVIFGHIKFDYDKEKSIFDRSFKYIDNAMGENAFLIHSNNQPRGGLKPSYFEATTIATSNIVEKLGSVSPDVYRDKVIATYSNPDFKSNIGPGSNSPAKMKGRIDVMDAALHELV